jgi:hypothetical protein
MGANAAFTDSFARLPFNGNSPFDIGHNFARFIFPCPIRALRIPNEIQKLVALRIGVSANHEAEEDH